MRTAPRTSARANAMGKPGSREPPDDLVPATDDQLPPEEDDGPDGEAPDADTALGHSPSLHAVTGDEAASTREPLHVTSVADMVEWLHTTIGTGDLAGMFDRAGSVVMCPQITIDGYIPPAESDPEPCGLRTIDSSVLASRVQLLRWCFKLVEDDKGRKTPVATMFPKAAATVMVDTPDLQPNLRKLRSVVNTPTVRADGSILDHPGYDDQTQMLYLPDPGLHVPPVATNPDAGELETAVSMLMDTMLCDFSWNSDGDGANYVGMMLTPLMRAITPGPYKLGVIQARVKGSGKSYLAEALRTLHGGEIRGDIPQNDEEFRKQVTSQLIDTTGGVMTWDNVRHKVESAGLDALLTTAVWSDRLLGQNRNVRVPNDRLWTATGNNVRIGGDLARRCLWVTIDPKMQRPWLRTGFTIADFPEWVREHRGALLHALLVLIRSWIVAGKPVPKARSADSYGRWVQTVDGILAHTRTVLGLAGIPGRFDDPDTVAVELTEEDTDLVEFIEAIRKVYGEQAWTVRDLLGKVETRDRESIAAAPAGATWSAKPFPVDALPADMPEQAAKAHNVQAVLARRLGGWLKTQQGRYVDGFAIEAAGSKGRDGVPWRVVAEAAAP